MLLSVVLGVFAAPILILGLVRRFWGIRLIRLLCDIALEEPGESEWYLNPDLVSEMFRLRNFGKWRTRTWEKYLRSLVEEKIESD